MTARCTAPLEIHICWPAGAELTDKGLMCADEIHRRLGRWIAPGDPAPSAYEGEGAGMSVLIGTSTDILGRPPLVPRLIVGIFDTIVQRDDALERLIAADPLNLAVCIDVKIPNLTPCPPGKAVDRLVSRITRALGRKAEAPLFVHEARGEAFTQDLWARLNERELTTFFRRPESVDERSLRDAGDGGVLVHVRRDSTVTTQEASPVVLAKELTMPVVGVVDFRSGEGREQAYGGNGPVLLATPDSVIDEVCRVWISHVHFKAEADEIRDAFGLPLDTVALSRPPELVDFALGTLPAASTVILYPDPPLPRDEGRLIKRQYPRARTVTPTTVHGQILARSVRPPFDGKRIALSVSDSPTLPKFDRDGKDPTRLVWSGTRDVHGLTSRHYRDVLEQLTVSLVRAGAELAYGGHLDAGYSVTLDRIVDAHQRLERDYGEILHLYATPETIGKSVDIGARIHMCEAKLDKQVPGDVKVALDLSEMRSTMGRECHARIILGGRTAPSPHADGKALDRENGYAGRFPGQTEEAWYTLTDGKPLYVIGAFGGAAELVGHALRGVNKFASEYVEGFGNFRADFDANAKGSAASLEAMYADFAKHAAVLNGTDRDAMWTNGLTVEENELLFRSTRPSEITALIMRGLLRLSRKGSGDTITVMPFNGSITDVPAVDAYIVPVLDGMPMGGADRALDEAMQGELRRQRERLPAGRLANPGSIEVVRTVGNQLAGDWVAMLSLGPSTMPPEQQPTSRALGIAIANRALAAGWSEVAVVPMGGNLRGLDAIGPGVHDLIEGIRSVPNQPLRTIVVCEYEAEKYGRIVPGLLQLEQASADVRVRALPARPAPFSQGTVATVMTVRREKDIETSIAPPRGSTVIPIQNAQLLEAINQLLTQPALPDNDGAVTAIKNAVRSALFSDASRAQLLGWVQHPIRVQHDDAAASLPFELALTVQPPDGSEYVFASERGVSRTLLTSTPARAARRLSGKPRILLVVDPTQDLPLSRREADLLTADLTARGASMLPPLVGPAATRDAVLAALRTADIFHYSGHADPSGLLLANGERFDAAAFESLGDSAPVVVVLNGCRTAVPASGRTSEETLARAVLQSGSRCFVGTGWLVPDETAAFFGRHFLRQVVDALPIGLAFARTLATLRDELHQTNHWFYYRLYGDPDFVCH